MGLMVYTVPMKTLICGGTIYDGTGGAPYASDILLDGDRIAAIAPGLSAEGAERVDAAGLAVTPGFIDMHRHADIAALVDPDFGRIELAQGITSTVVGNCGLAPMPSASASRREAYAFLEPVVGPIPEGMFFADYTDYAEALAGAKLRLNIGFLAGCGAIKMAVKGFAKTPYSPEELDRAQALLAGALDAGALGASVGIMYQPECFSTRDELAQLLRPLAARNGLLCAHIRGEGDTLVASVEEIIEIGARAGVRVNISHFKATGIRNWRKAIFEAIDRIERARAQGQEVTVDFYPYAGGATTLQSLLPPCVLQADNSAGIRALATPEGKQTVRDAIYRSHPGWDNAVLETGWARILVSSTSLPEHTAYAGRTIVELADAEGYAEPADFICDLLASEEGRVGIILMSMHPDDIDDIARLPYTAVISDALYSGGNHPHPRLYGAFPRIIRDFALERNVLPLPFAIHKMTGMPAARLGLKDRGILAPGNIADINVFDPREVCDHATFEKPARLATGMRRVFVGGEIAWHDETPVAYAGRFIYS